MTINVKAVYAGGVLKPTEPLSLPENQAVLIELTPLESVSPVAPKDLASLYGLWRGLGGELDADLAEARAATRAKLNHLFPPSS